MAYPFVQAKHYHAGGNRPIHRVVIHDMEYPEKPSAAEDVARIFAQGSRVASAHYCVDNDSIVQCVHDGDVAYHAPPNTHSIGIEHAGYANQKAAGWADPYSEAMLQRSAALTALLCHEYDLPIVWLSVADLQAGKRGITSHNNVSLAFHKSTHTDPGPTFPVAHYLELVRWAYAGGGQPAPIPPEEDDAMKMITANDDSTAGIWLLTVDGRGHPQRANLSPDEFWGLVAADVKLVKMPVAELRKIPEAA